MEKIYSAIDQGDLEGMKNAITEYGGLDLVAKDVVTKDLRHNNRDGSLLYQAIMNDNLEIFQYLKDQHYGRVLNSYGYEQYLVGRDTPIHAAVIYGSMPVFEELLKRDVSLDAMKAGEGGYTPLGLSIMHNKPEYFKLLLEHIPGSYVDNTLIKKEYKHYHYGEYSQRGVRTTADGTLLLYDTLFGPKFVFNDHEGIPIMQEIYKKYALNTVEKEFENDKKRNNGYSYESTAYTMFPKLFDRIRRKEEEEKEMQKNMAKKQQEEAARAEEESFLQMVREWREEDEGER